MMLRTWIVVSAAGLVFAGCDMFGSKEGGEGEAKEGGEAAAASGASGAAAASGASGAAAEAPKPAAPDATPAGACAALLEASKSGDAAKVEALSTDAVKEMMGKEEAKKGMMEALKDASCGEPKTEGDKSVIPVKSGENTRDIPFVKQGEAWKFDAAAYAEKYPREEKGKAKGKEKGKKAKGKKGK